MIIYRGPSLIDGAPIVCIATLGSANPKTGAMIQTWILRDDVSPLEASRSGDDKSICGDCPHRQNTGGGCYVNIGQAPRSVYEAYTRGKYDSPEATVKVMVALQTGVAMRIGAYGDPMAVPASVWHDILDLTTGRWTGYTHQWAAPNRLDAPGYRGFLMASVDSEEQAERARAHGWRYFHVAPAGQGTGQAIECPADTHGTKCEDCGLCSGTEFGTRARRKSIFIRPHGAMVARVVKRLAVVQ